jgi:hypothetical protein
MCRGHSALIVVGACAGRACATAASHIRHSERQPQKSPTRIAIEVACVLPISPNFPRLRGCSAFGPSPSDLASVLKNFQPIEPPARSAKWDEGVRCT